MIPQDMDDYEYQDLIAEERARRRYMQRLLSHPDCRDPDHPGCEKCIEEDDE